MSYLSGSASSKRSPSMFPEFGTALLYFEVVRCCKTRPKSETLLPLVAIRGFRLGDSWVVLGSHQTLAGTSSPRFNLGGATTTHLTFCSGESAFTSSTLVCAASKEAMASEQLQPAASKNRVAASAAVSAGMRPRQTRSSSKFSINHTCGEAKLPPLSSFVLIFCMESRADSSAKGIWKTKFS